MNKVALVVLVALAMILVAVHLADEYYIELNVRKGTLKIVKKRKR